MKIMDNVQEVAHRQEHNDVLPSISKKELELALDDYDKRKQRFLASPTKQQLLGPVTVFCMVLNRTIGSGIFTTPPKVLAGVGSVSGLLMIWSSTGLIVLYGLIYWLELDLSIPVRWVTDYNGNARRVATPQSGGEKNFIEFIVRRPRLFITSVYAIMFVMLGNISGNALAFGIYVMTAAGRDPIYDRHSGYEKEPIILLAIGVLTLCAGIHFFTRRGGIYVNNAFAAFTISTVLVLTILGFVQRGKNYLHSNGISELPVHTTILAAIHAPNTTSMEINDASYVNLDPHWSFRGVSSSLANYIDIIFVLFSYTGFEQPFSVLSEVGRPRKVFPTYTLLGMLFTAILYNLESLSYFCVVPKEAYTTSLSSIDMAGNFMHYLFDKSMGPQTARRLMAGLTAISIFGNIIVMTFTAARVKQEIAKEGILPYSLFFATSHITPWAKLQAWRRNDLTSTGIFQANPIDLKIHLEQTPITALFLHWLTTILFIAITSMLRPVTAYAFLVSFYGYVSCATVGFFVGGGLVYLKLDSRPAEYSSRNHTFGKRTVYHEETSSPRRFLSFDVDLGQEELVQALEIAKNGLIAMGRYLKKTMRRPLARGWARLEWTCDCGKLMYGDYRQGDPAKLERLRLELNSKISTISRSQAGHNDDDHTNAVGDRTLGDAFYGKPCSIDDSSQAHINDATISGTTPPASSITTNSTPAYTTMTGKRRFFELCVNTGGQKVNLVEIDISDVQTDAVLFRRIYDQYYQIRRHWLKHIFIRPVDINFVQFGVEDRHRVGIYAKPLEIPPPEEVSNGRYHYFECPLTVQPPMDYRTFLHYLKAPPEHNKSTFLDRLPKKVGCSVFSEQKLPLAFGWGVHIIEGPNRVALGWTAFGAVLLSFFVALVYDLSARTSEQGFSIGQWMLASLTTGTGALCIQFLDN